MTDRIALPDSNEPPEDVASLYSWANLHGAKYRDFSTLRAQTREKARQRVQQAIDEERERIRQQAEAQRDDEGHRTANPVGPEEQAHLAELAIQLAAQLAAQQATHQANEQAAQYAGPAGMAPNGRVAQQTTGNAAWHPPRSEPSAPQEPYQAPQSAYPDYPAPPGYTPAPPFAPMREETATPPFPGAWTPAQSREQPARPAWITDKPEPAPTPTVPQAPGDTFQRSRDRLTSRWFGLKAILQGPGAAPATEPAPMATNANAPVLAVFSLAGGVGKTSLVATLGRALSARGERVLLVDTAAFGLLPFFFGARDQRPGQLRTFSPPAASGDSPIQMITIDPESLGPENAAQEVLAGEITKHTRGVSRIIIDLATASGSSARRILKLSPLVLVPVIPDMNSVVSVGSIDAFFEHYSGAAGKLPHYVLNQFDPSLPLHLDVREVLREQVAERLLPFALRRAPAVSEALAEGMTVMDYAPNSSVAEDFGSLAGWVKSLSAPASVGFRGVRWSER